MSAPGRILAVDAGTVRVGLAVSDEERKFAFPLEVIAAKGAIERIRVIVSEKEIRAIVIGMPLTLRGEIGPEGQRVQKFIERMRKALPEIPITTRDERMSSAAADQFLSDSSDRKSTRDAVAASLILESYIKTLPK